MHEKIRTPSCDSKKNNKISSGCNSDIKTLNEQRGYFVKYAHLYASIIYYLSSMEKTNILLSVIS